MRCCCWSLTLLTSLVFAQTSGVPDTRELMQVNVAATNAKGEPVTDLKAEDFELREDGKVRPLEFFRLAGKSSMAPREGGNTNIGSRPARAPLVILLDRWNESLISTAQSGLRLSSAIDRSESVDDVYVYFLDNRGELIALRALPGTEVAAKTTPAELRAKLDEAFRTLPGVRERDDFNVRVTKTFRALGSLTAQMGVIPGRKSLIWLTSGFPLVIRIPGGGFLDFTPQVRGLSEAAAQGQVAVYTVDQSTQGAGASVGGQARAMLRLYSELTGGRWYTSDSAERAMSDAMVDARGSYRIGFESPARGKDGQFHKIRVDTSRKGVHLLARDGFAGNVTAPNAIEVETLVLSNARRSPLDAAEIGLWVGMSAPFQARPNAAKPTHLDIRVDAADVFIDKSGERARAQVDVMVAAYSGGFVKEASKPERMDLSMDAAQLAQAAKDGLSIPLDVRVGADIEKIKVMVFDPRIQALGTVTIPLK